MLDFLYYLAVLAFVIAVIVVGALLWRNYMDGARPASGFFRQRQEPRLDIVAQANVDGRRRLVLIRRDDTEHLIMTGGPVDVVIETGIVGARPLEGDANGAAAAAFSRPPKVME
jgi:flagellar protein FliO/FliZ